MSSLFAAINDVPRLAILLNMLPLILCRERDV